MQLCSRFLSSSFFKDAQNKGVGAVGDMGGKALMDAGLAKDGFLGTTVDIVGGNTTFSFFENAPNGVGAVADMGGKALPDNASLVEEVFLGAAVDKRGNAALLELFPPSGIHQTVWELLSWEERHCRTAELQNGKTLVWFATLFFCHALAGLGSLALLEPR